MKKSELLSALEGVPDDALIVVASDDEGNYFHPLGGLDADVTYLPCDGCRTPHGELYHPEDGDPPEGAVRAVVLWP